jgi:hypothetical protein
MRFHDATRSPRLPSPQTILCPYCGLSEAPGAERCGSCGGFFDELSRKVTQQHMGPWFVRDPQQPFRPGCTYEILTRQIQRGKIGADTALRGPTTRQFWMPAKQVLGISHLVGYCHACGSSVPRDSKQCPRCSASFAEPHDREALGLMPLDPHVWEEVEKARAEEAALLAKQAASSGSRPANPRSIESAKGPSSSGVRRDATGSGTGARRDPSSSGVRRDATSSGIRAKTATGTGISVNGLGLSGPASSSGTKPPGAAPQPIVRPLSGASASGASASGIRAKTATGTGISAASLGNAPVAVARVIQSPAKPTAGMGIGSTLNSSRGETLPWMSSGGGAVAAPPSATQAMEPLAKPGPNYLIWALVAFNVVLALAVVSIIMLRGGPDAKPTGPTAPTNPAAPAAQPVTPAAVVPTPTPVAVEAPKPKPEPVAVKPAPQPVKPVEVAVAPPVVPKPTPVATPTPTPAPTGGKIGFFGVNVATIPGVTPEQLTEFEKSFNQASELLKANKAKEALVILQQIKANLPAGATAEGLDDAIAKVESMVKRKELEKFFDQ